MTNEENLSAVRDYIRKLSFLHGFPDTEEKFLAATEAYADFASAEPYFPKFEDTKKVLGESVVPVEWLCKRIRTRCRFFPSPIEARLLYAEYFKPRDGEEPFDLQGKSERGDD